MLSKLDCVKISCVLMLLPLMAGCPGVDPTGDGLVAEGISARLGEPIPSATAEQLATFERGRDVALRRFDLADGLGPDFNVTFCGSCHERPVLGGSAGTYRNFFLSGRLTGGGAFIPGDFGGVLRKNRYADDASFFPPVDPDLNTFAQRNPIPFFGVGLLAELTDEEILSRVDADDADGDGISGRANFDRGFVGRFGRKSQTVSIEGFIRGPLNNHLGITTDPLTEAQRSDLPVDSSAGAALRRAGINAKPVGVLQAAAPDGPLRDSDGTPDPELPRDELFDLIAFSMLMAAPELEPLTLQSETGRQLFHQANCSACHVPRLNGPRGPLPVYSDLLLHDMGEALADGIVMNEASGSEFRTQPLWGLAPVGPYLHDGRAATIEAAILAHGGEAQASRDAFDAYSTNEKAALVEFLMSLGGRDQFSTGLVPPDTDMGEVGSYGGPIREMSADESARFLTGRELFDREFSFDDGAGALQGDNGPRFNGDSCRACHFDPVIGGSGPRGVNVMRHGAVDNGSFTAPLLTPNTILHTQARSFVGPANIPEDGINIFEPRQTPHLFGAGLIDSISDDAIRANADPEDTDQNGISGRIHLIVDSVGERVGKFGWKAQVPSIAEFVRDAMAAEIGLTVAAQDGLTFGTTDDDDGVPDPELSVAEAEDLAFFIASLAAPPRQTIEDATLVATGETLFESVGCAMCHVVSLPGTLNGESIDVPLYSDLLLHQILDDERVGIEDGDAGQLEFRTAPLWGLSQTAPYLHNGLADTIDEAIRLHGGEATTVREAYEALPDDDQAALLAFLNTL